MSSRLHTPAFEDEIDKFRCTDLNENDNKKLPLHKYMLQMIFLDECELQNASQKDAESLLHNLNRVQRYTLHFTLRKCCFSFWSSA